MWSIQLLKVSASNPGGVSYPISDQAAGLVIALFLVFAATAALFDIKKRIIPNSLCVLIALVGLTVRSFGLNPFSLSYQSLWLSLLGGLIGGGALLLVALAGALVLRSPAMGGGDIKLMAACCIWLSLPCVALCLILSALLGGVLAGVMLITRRATLKSELPFGLMIAAGAAVSLLFGDAIIRGYFAMLGF